jgi:hypothetical protein
MKGWKAFKNIDFDFRDAHDLRDIRDWSLPDTVRRTLRVRFSTADQVIVLIGEETKTHHRFVRWEIDTALGLDLPIIAVNLNNMREMDPDRCHPYCAISMLFISPINLEKSNMPWIIFRASMTAGASEKGPLAYPASLYRTLGLL